MKTTGISKRGVPDGSRKSNIAPGTIVVPLNFSALAERALDRAKEYAREFESKLVLVHAVEPIVQPVEYAIVPSDMAEINLRQAAASRKRFEEVKSGLESEGLSCKVEVKVGRPWQVIVETAKSLKADLIIIPTGMAG